MSDASGRNGSSAVTERPAGERGRPRSPEIDKQVLEAVIQRLVRQGYARLSVSSIAEELGIGKPTIYLRWHSKAALVAAALRLLGNDLPSRVKFVGEVRSDLVSYLSVLRTHFEITGVGLTGALWSEEDENPELIQSYRDVLVYPNRQVLRDILNDGVNRGELTRSPRLETAIHMMVGSLYAAYIAAEKERIDIDAIVDVALKGLLTEPAKAA
ncbi:MAG TPA: TetR/AcrR family transcriptional regulator [Chloroflexota bacterium]|nr:TetR/AcrR family transcriptional regulator [Chloroflexota bacterium]